MRRAVLRAEAPAHVLLDDTDMRELEAKGARDVAACHEDSLRRLPHGDASALPLGDGAVRLERSMKSDRRAILAFDDDVGAAECGIGVATLCDARRVA